MDRVTFQSLNDAIGAEEIYSGTSVDAATQAILLEWNFNKYLSMKPNEEQTWLRRYRRNLNMYYPIYLDYLRVESVRSNMDPFITEFMERIHSDSGTSTSTGSGSKSVEGSSTGSDRTITDNGQVRTPDLTTAGTTGNTRTDNLANSNSTSDSGTISNSGSDTSEDDTQTRGMNIVYPEANMNSIPSTLNGFPSSIDYAEGETDTFGKTEHTGSNSNQETRNLSQTSSGTQTGTVTDSGSNNVRETGTERIDFDGDIQKTLSNSNSSEETSSNSLTATDTREGQETEQGRHGKSIADILPQAISAITTTNAIKWFNKQMNICFDNYIEI